MAGVAQGGTPYVRFFRREGEPSDWMRSDAADVFAPLREDFEVYGEVGAFYMETRVLPIGTSLCVHGEERNRG